MILENDSLLNFEYDTTSHIMSVSYPDLTGITISQIQSSLAKLCSTVANYDVKKLLLDFRPGVIDMTEAQYQELLIAFLKQLSHTRLEKVARVLPDTPSRKYLVDHYASIAGRQVYMPFKDRSFTRKSEALQWLNESDAMSMLPG